LFFVDIAPTKAASKKKGEFRSLQIFLSFCKMLPKGFIGITPKQLCTPLLHLDSEEIHHVSYVVISDSLNHDTLSII